MRNNSEYLSDIEDKLTLLRNKDTNYSVFGSEEHKYKFNSPINEVAISQFEKEHAIILPTDYLDFILKFGNGGCGPQYGLMQLQQGALNTPHYPEDSDRIELAKAFRFKSFWNLENFTKDDYCLWETEYEKSKWADGMLRICNEGCGIFANLVITGTERGTIWIDDRANDAGIYPFAYHNGKEETTFLDWYSTWLDNAIIKTT